MKINTPGSMSPVREPLMMPPVGVSAIEVSMHWPFRIAEIDAPFPRCATISLLGHVGLQLVHDRLIRDAVIAVAPHAHGVVLRGNRQVRRHLGQRAMEVRVENGKVRDSRETAAAPRA